MTSTQECVDRMLIAELIQRERAARDGRLWQTMAECWHPQSLVDVSWFHGSGPEFVAASARQATGSTLSFHQMGPSVVTVKGDRAIADTGCAMHGMRMLHQAEVAVISHTRLVSRAIREGEDWLVAGLKVEYIRDLVVPRDPGRLPEIDRTLLVGYRDAYRYLSYVLTQSSLVPRTDLPGVDLPETVTALRAAEQRWLEDGSEG